MDPEDLRVPGIGKIWKNKMKRGGVRKMQVYPVRVFHPEKRVGLCN